MLGLTWEAIQGLGVYIPPPTATGTNSERCMYYWGHDAVLRYLQAENFTGVAPGAIGERPPRLHPAGY